ncbi:MAG: FkbM family methyltransferase [Thermoleophilaceae bacterium]|nr:FkbM family methyltransferase [Thermoleophilaceae bacterium]
MRRARTRAWVGAAVKRAGERAGLEIGMRRPPAERRARLLAERRIELVVDAGAHRGLYGRELREHGYGGRIVSFEPATAAFGELARRAAAAPPWEARQLALSDEPGELRLSSAENFASALPPAGQLASLFPEAAPAASETVPAVRLDAQDLDLPPGQRTLLKLDVQGYELRVLRGASGLLPEVGVVESELSVVPLYEGAPLIADMLNALAEAGFRLAALEPILRDWRTGEHLQFDGTFVRG